MKKISVLLVIAIAISILSGIPFSVSAYSTDFVIDTDGGLLDYTGPVGEVVIPKEVKYIWAGFYNKAITKVTFEEGSQLEYIAGNAFAYVKTAMDITLPDKPGITIANYSLYTAQTVTITIPNASTILVGDNVFYSSGVVHIYGKNASLAEVYSTKGAWWYFHDLEYTVDGSGWLTNYAGIGGEIVIPKEVTNIYSTVLNNKTITKISFEAGSLLTQFGDAANYILSGNTDVQIVLPVREGITIKAYSLWGDASRITDPNLTTVYETSSVWSGRAFTIIAPLGSTAKTYFDTVVATGVTWWTYQAYATAANAFNITYPINAQGIVSGFGIDKTLAAFMSGVTKGSSVEIKAYNGETELLPTKFIGSGTTIRVNNGITTTEYHAVIMGDLTGDGSISIDDLAKIKGYLLKMDELSGYKFIAGEFFVKGEITISNLLFLKKYLLGLVAIAN